MARYHMVKKIEDIFIRFGATHERDRLADRRTDRQTDGHRMPAIAALCIASHGKNHGKRRKSRKSRLPFFRDFLVSLVCPRDIDSMAAALMLYHIQVV